MSKDFVLVSALNKSDLGFSYNVPKEQYTKVSEVFIQACEDHPSHTAALYEYFLGADRSDLFNPKGWHQQEYGNNGNNGNSRYFSDIVVDAFDPNERLIAKHYVGNLPLEERNKVLEANLRQEREAAPEVQ